MSKSGYRDLVVWQKARALASRVYRVTRQFPRFELFGLTAQMRRAAVSIPCNVAEGHGRRTTADRIQFLMIARGSLLELETQALIAADLEFMKCAEADDIVERTTDVARALNGLIRFYTTRPK